jgi:microcompartment protein CcmL/EutN
MPSSQVGVPVENPASAIISEIKVAVDESVAEVKEAIAAGEATEEQHWNKLAEIVADKVADQVYDKVKKLVTDLLDAAEDAAEIAAESIEAPAEAEVEEASDEATEDVAPQDVAPKRGHVLFRKVNKKEE